MPNANIVFGGSGASRTVTITPAPNQSGTATITLTVTDGSSATASDSFVLTVTPVNDVPTISDTTDKTTPQNTVSGPHTFTIGDVETAAASLTVTAASSNTTLVPVASIVFGGSGSSRTVTITPASNQTGAATITLTVSDGNGGTAADSFVLTVTPVNAAPTISDVTDKTTNEDTATPALGFTVGDAETPAASLTVAGSSSNTTLVPVANIVFGGSGSSRTATITPALNQTGTATITLTVTDGSGGSASDTFVLTVTAVNDVPTISDVTDKTTNEDTPTPALSVTVGDVETPAASLTLTAASSNTLLVPTANIVLGGSGASRTVTITPALNQLGTATITLTVGDGTGGTAADSFVLTVTAVNDLPTISDTTDKTTNEDTATPALAVTIGDAETPAASLTFSASSSNPTLVPTGNIVFGGSGANRTVTLIPAPDQPGTTTITLTVTDGNGGSANDTFVLTVIPVNDPPVVNAGPDVSTAFPAPASLAGTAVDIDGPALVRVWSQVSGPGTATFTDPNAATTSANFTAPGTYVLRLTANDGQFNVSDDVSVAVTGANMGLSFDGVSKRVTFGPAPGLGAATFTIETWFKREGAGATVSTGTGGVTAIPLVTKGMAQAEGGNVDMNYFLGIDGTSRVLVADFEDTATGLNHPVQGVTTDLRQRLVSRRGDLRRHDVEAVPQRPARCDARRRRLHAAFRQHPARRARHGDDVDRGGHRRVPGRARRAARLERRAQWRRHPGGDDWTSDLRTGIDRALEPGRGIRIDCRGQQRRRQHRHDPEHRCLGDRDAVCLDAAPAGELRSAPDRVGRRRGSREARPGPRPRRGHVHGRDVVQA